MRSKTSSAERKCDFGAPPTLAARIRFDVRDCEDGSFPLLRNLFQTIILKVQRSFPQVDTRITEASGNAFSISLLMHKLAGP